MFQNLFRAKKAKRREEEENMIIMRQQEDLKIQQMAPTAYEEAVKRNEKIRAEERQMEEWRKRTLAAAREPIHWNTAPAKDTPPTARSRPKYYGGSSSRHRPGGDGGDSGGGSSNDSGGGGYSGASTGDSGCGDSGGGDGGGCGD